MTATQYEAMGPSAIYDSMDTALHAATCLCHLHKDGATVWTSIIPCDGQCEYAGRCGGHERYVVSSKAAWTHGAAWVIPDAPGSQWEACYTVTRAKS